MQMANVEKKETNFLSKPKAFKTCLFNFIPFMRCHHNYSPSFSQILTAVIDTCLETYYASSTCFIRF